MIIVGSFQHSVLCDSLICSPQPVPFVFPSLCSQVIKYKQLFPIPNTHLQSAYRDASPVSELLYKTPCVAGIDWQF